MATCAGWVSSFVREVAQANESSGQSPSCTEVSPWQQEANKKVSAISGLDSLRQPNAKTSCQQQDRSLSRQKVLQSQVHHPCCNSNCKVSASSDRNLQEGIAPACRRTQSDSCCFRKGPKILSFERAKQFFKICQQTTILFKPPFLVMIPHCGWVYAITN